MTPAIDALPDLRLMQLISPSLPIGGFTYSQGLERAVDRGWVSDAELLTAWLHEQVLTTLARLDLPILMRLYEASSEKSLPSMMYWSRYLIASRETSELRAEECNRGRALATLLKSLEVIEPGQWFEALELCQSAGFAYAAKAWDIPQDNMLRGFAWSWVENLVLAGVKIVPLGQSDGQRILLKLAPAIVKAVTVAQSIDDDEIGASSPALSIASSQHQFQYTRLFRS
ncbi:MAG TPA: urease accessory protein UreF [Gammaproteobacteria bacterium]|nr:urease accessory protein UreF [Gammaproteobacteria bacterium]